MAHLHHLFLQLPGSVRHTSKLHPECRPTTVSIGTQYGPAKHTWDADLMVQEGCNAADVASGGSDVQRGGAA